jgi:hypothetical protein
MSTAIACRKERMQRLGVPSAALRAKFYSKNVHVGLITCCVVRLWPRVKSNAGSRDVEGCKHVKSQATTVYFRLGKLRRVSTYVQHVWGIIGHVTAEAGNTVGTDGAPPQLRKIYWSFPSAHKTFSEI